MTSWPLIKDLRKHVAAFFEDRDLSVGDFRTALHGTEWLFADGGHAVTFCEVREGAITPPPPPPSRPIRGVHDLSGGDWLISQGLTGWVTEAIYIDDGKPRQLNLNKYLEAGLSIIGRLSFSFATEDGGQGTYPGDDMQAVAFEHATAETIRINKPPEGLEDRLYWIYLNEYNNTREHPKGRFITPEMYAESYGWIKARLPDWANFGLGAIDPTNAGWGDWRPVFKDLLMWLRPDIIALHAYTHGPDPELIWHHKEFDHAPLLGAYYDMRMLETQMDCVPMELRDVPYVVTETNHLMRKDGSEGWEPDAGEKWVRPAYLYFASQGVDGACLFRFGHDQWKFEDLPGVLETLASLP